MSTWVRDLEEYMIIAVASNYMIIAVVSNCMIIGRKFKKKKKKIHLYDYGCCFKLYDYWTEIKKKKKPFICMIIAVA